MFYTPLPPILRSPCVTWEVTEYILRKDSVLPIPLQMTSLRFSRPNFRVVYDAAVGTLNNWIDANAHLHFNTQYAGGININDP